MMADPDAAILALGRDLDAAYAKYLAFRPTELAADSLDFPKRDRVATKALAMREQADLPAEALFKLPPPATLAGVAVLVRALAGFHCDLWDGELAKLDIEEQMLRLTIEATLALAGVDRVGRSAGGAS